MIRIGAYVSSVVIIIAATFLVPLPLVESSPGDATAIAPLIAVGGEITEVTGEFALLTVRVTQPSVAETVRALLSDDRILRSRETVIPTTLDRRTYFELQREEFRRTFRVAAAVGLRAAGLEVGIRTAPHVVGVLEGSPADGLLQVGDIIIEFEGEPVVSAEELAERARRSSVGDELQLVVDRGGERVAVTVVAGRLPGLEQAGMGITSQTIEEEVVLPVAVDLVDQNRIGGPSAGLMIALTVYDLVAEEDLATGRRIAGAAHREEVAQQLHPGRGQHRLGMELHALDGEVAVPQAHDEAVGGLRGDLQIGGTLSRSTTSEWYRVASNGIGRSARTPARRW
jgi:Lon-like protease